MAELINLETFDIEDDGEEKETVSIIDLDTFEITEQAAPVFREPVIAQTEPTQVAEQQDISGFQPVAYVDPDEGAFGSNVEQGLLNIGCGILRGFGELRSSLGDEGADKFLQDLEISQNIERQKTAQISEGEPIKSFAGEILGEVLGFPLGGGGASLGAKLLSGAATSAAGGGLSAAGRGESGADVAIEAGMGAVLDAVLQGVGGVSKFVEISKE